MEKCLLLFLLIRTIYSQENLNAVECPFPEGQESSVNLEEECRTYTACAWAPEERTCHMDLNSLAGYVVTSEKEYTERGFKIHLRKFDPSRTMFNADIQELVFEAIHHEDYHLQIKIYDRAVARYEVPIPLKLPNKRGTSPLYSLAVSEEGSEFSFSITRNTTGTAIFSTLGPLTFENQFIQFTTPLASSYLYGIGETYHLKLKRTFDKRTTIPIFLSDEAAIKENLNLAGAHPYYVNIEDDEGNTHSVLFYNSNAMEYSIFSLEDGTPAVTFRTIGGIIDLHFFLGPFPEDVNVQYSKTIGTTVFPPYWSLGFHLSKSGYQYVQGAMILFYRMIDAGIPQDGHMYDIEYMDLLRVFTFNNIEFQEMPFYIRQMHEDGVRTTVILYMAVDFNNAEPLNNGIAQDAFVKWMDDSLVPSNQERGAYDYMVGFLYPDNKTIYPDFLKPATREYWMTECLYFQKHLGFDGVWISTAQLLNFGTNLNRPQNYPEALEDWSLKCPDNAYDSPPYPTKASYHEDNESQRLSDGTLCMSGLHTDENRTYLHYDIHNINGYFASQVHHECIAETYQERRPFVLLGASFPGAGQYGAYSLAGNFADWEHLRQSIPGILEFNLFGTPFVGPDICGESGDSNEALCARWMQLGAFYPFCRNHNGPDFVDQDPANPEWPLVNSVSRDVLFLRYKFLPYLYYLFYRAHIFGGSVARPLFNVFPTDVYARDIDDQFLWADGLMIAPVIYENDTARDVYFPKSLWYELQTGYLYSFGGETKMVDAPVDFIPLYIRGGTIMQYQDPEVSTDKSRLGPFSLLIALDENQTAKGEIYWDNHETLYSEENSFLCSILYSNNTLNITVERGKDIVELKKYSDIVIYGFPWQPSEVIIHGEGQAVYLWNFNVALNVLTVTIFAYMTDDVLLEMIQ